MLGKSFMIIMTALTAALIVSAHTVSLTSGAYAATIGMQPFVMHRAGN